MCDSRPHLSRNCRCRGGLLRGFIQPKLLLQLTKRPAHGYELMETLGQTGELASSDAGNLYRILRGLEEDGLVHSDWDTSGTGPARRKYALTEEGIEYLAAWITDLRETRQMLDDFLAEYERQFPAAKESSSVHVRTYARRQGCDCENKGRKDTIHEKPAGTGCIRSSG